MEKGEGLLTDAFLVVVLAEIERAIPERTGKTAQRVLQGSTMRIPFGEGNLILKQ
jgi:hypothetical protein